MRSGRQAVDRLTWLQDLARDVRYAIRTWRRHPGFAIVSILTLALGIGATTAVFSVVEAVLLRPLPYAQVDRLVTVWDGHVTDRHLAKIFASYADFETWRRDSRTVEQLVAVTWATGDQILTGYGAAKVVLAIPAGVEFFSLLGVSPAMGRAFESADLTRGCTVVLAGRFWRNALGAPADIVGRSLALDGRACAVAGVMPERFAFYPSAADMWMLITPTREQLPPDRYQGVGVFARLRPGVTRERANAELSALHREAHAHDPHGAAFAPTVYPLQDEFTWLAGRNLRLTLWVLFGAVAAVLLIASINVANLLLGRTVTRQRELAIRAAIGSGRWRLARQILTEALVLSACATCLGVAIAEMALRYLRGRAPVDLPPGTILAIDGMVLGFAIGVAVLTALLFGLLPAWRSSRADIHTMLKAHGAGFAGRPHTSRASSVLIAVQMACAMVLLVGAGLLTQSIVRLGSVPLGFNPDGLLTMSLRLPRTKYPQAERRADFHERLLSGVASLPGVDGAALSTTLLRGRGVNLLLVEGRPDPTPETSSPDVGLDSVSADYFRVMGVAIQSGRAFQPGDRADSPPVSIVNEALARKYFPGIDPIGHRIRTPNSTWSTIVGVAGNQKSMSVFQEMNWVDTPMLYRPLAQGAEADASLVLRSASPASIGAAVQRLVSGMDADVPVTNVLTMRQRISRDLAYPEFRAAVLSAFAGVALVLAAVGLYAVLAQLVAQRTHEFGVRMALGARARDIVRLVGVQGGAPTAIGLAAGIAAALAIERVLSSLLYNAGAADPTAIVGVAILLVVTAAAAMYVPARKATRVDPLVALRSE